MTAALLRHTAQIIRELMFTELAGWGEFDPSVTVASYGTRRETLLPAVG
jgi:hypothetical protein